VKSLGRLGWALIGGMVVLVAALSVWPEPYPYSGVIVPAARILEREVPFGPPSIPQRIVYVYLTPDVRAVAPGAVVADVARFCRPTLIAQTDTVRPTELVPSVIRTVQTGHSIIPLRRDPLFVSSMNGYGDLIGEDFRTRPGFGIASGLMNPYQTVVRYSRLAPLREVAEGALWWAAIEGGRRLVKAVVR